MNSSTSEIAVVIPNWNGRAWLPGCLDALAKQESVAFETWVVDNGSSDGSQEWLRAERPDIKLLALERNMGFAAAANAGIRACSAPLIALLNSDTIPAPDWLASLRQTLEAAGEKTGAVTGKMLDMSNPALIENAGDVLSWQGAAEKRGHGMPAEKFNAPQEIFSCCAGGTLYRRSFLEAVGMFDEGFFAYLEDMDLCLRGRLMGFRYLYEPRAVLLHRGHGSRMPHPRYIRLTTANRLKLFFKNVPASLLFRHLPSLLHGQFYHAVCSRRPAAVLAGYADFARALPHLIEQRRAVRRATTLSNKEIDSLLEKKMRQPGLLASFRCRRPKKNGAP